MINKIKEKGPSIFFLLVFMVGLSISLVPNLVKYGNEMARSNTASEFIYTSEQRKQEEIDAEQALCDEYNRVLFSKSIEYDPYADYSILDTYKERLFRYDCIAAVEIPKINLKIPVYQGTDDFTLAKGAGHLVESSLPVGGESTHSVISAHNGDPNAQSFSDLEELEIGDCFFVSSNGSTKTYQVDEINVVDPSDLSPTKIIEGQDYCSLITCTPRNVNSHRLIVRGVRIADMEVEEVERGRSSSETSIVYGLIALGVITAAVVVCRNMNRNKKSKRNETKKIEQ